MTGALTDDQLARFAADGYIVLTPSALGPPAHQRLYDRAAGLYDQARVSGSDTAHLGILGDTLRTSVPEADRMLADPVVDGALTSILGAGYAIHPHSYCHVSGKDQPFHQDGNLPWNERGHYRSHRPDWAMLFYYPQAVDDANGPTEVIPGSHYLTIDHETDDGGWRPGDRIESFEQDLGVADLPRRYVHLDAGQVVLAHYDLIHRGSRVSGDGPPRYMYKFYATRVHDPADPLSSHPPVGSGLDRLDAPSEPERIAAAYALGRLAASGDEAALAELAAELEGEAESTRRAAGVGLRVAGAAALDVVGRASSSDRAPVRRPAIAALGAIASDLDSAGRAAATDALLAALADPDDLARSNAAYALGLLARTDLDPAAVDRIADALLDRLAPDAEPDNAFGAGFSRSTIRQSAAWASLQLLANHPLPPARFEPLAATDPDRYIRGLLTEGLSRL